MPKRTKKSLPHSRSPPRRVSLPVPIPFFCGGPTRNDAGRGKNTDRLHITTILIPAIAHGHGLHTPSPWKRRSPRPRTARRGSWCRSPPERPCPREPVCEGVESESDCRRLAIKGLRGTKEEGERMRGKECGIVAGRPRAFSRARKVKILLLWALIFLRLELRSFPSTLHA